MIDMKKKVCFKMKPKLISTVKNQFIPWYFKAFNKKITFTQVIERGIIQFIWETTTNLMRSASLFRYDPDGNPYWYWTRPEKDVMNEA